MKKLLLMLGSLPLLGGCSRVAVTTDVKKDGSWTRTDVFTQSTSGPSDTQLADTFVVPQGAGWTSSKATAKDELKVTAVLRSKGPGQFSKDVRVRGKNKGPVLVSNDVTIRETSPGVWQYTEKLRWDGPKPKELASPPVEVLTAIKSALPPYVATDATAKALAPGMIRGLFSALFGPGQTVLPQMIFQPDAAEHILRQRMGRAIDQALGETLGSRITADERRATVRRLISSVMAQTKAGNSPSPGGATTKSMDGTDLPSLTFTLRPPGRITSSNGEVDKFSNETWWTLYPEAAALGDVVMKATWEMPPTAGGKQG
jgi:hypothetical protein